MRWLTERWQVKALALVLAVVLYFFTGTQITVERTITVQIDDSVLVGLPENYLVSRLAPREFDVTLAGPMAVVGALGDEGAILPALPISAQGLTEGRQEFDLTERLLQLDPQLTLRSSNIDRIEAAFSRVVEDVLTLDDRPQVVGLPEGLQADVSLERAKVIVRGPEDVIAAVKARGVVPVAPIDLSDIAPDLKGSLEVPVDLLVLADQPDVRAVEQPRAVVTVTPVPTRRPVGPLPIHLLSDPDFLLDYEVELSPEVIAITIAGPENLMRDADLASAVRAYVDVTDIKRTDTGEDRVVRVLAPSWASWSSVSVQVTIRRRSPGDVPPPPESSEDPVPEAQPQPAQPLP